MLMYSLLCILEKWAKTWTLPLDGNEYTISSMIMVLKHIRIYPAVVIISNLSAGRKRTNAGTHILHLKKNNNFIGIGFIITCNL
jgi:hypothetical protein